MLRAGLIASSQKIKVEGIGAKTKTYYWLNAFIREFVATLVSEKKTHIKMIFVLFLITFIISVIITIT